MIKDIDELRPLLGEEMCDIWRDVSTVINARSYRLMGGTAIVTYLRHRRSFDLDFMATKPFDGARLAQRFEKKLPDTVVSDADKNWASLRIRGVLIQVFSDRFGEEGKQPRWLAPCKTVSGLAVGSLPDLFASKLHAVSRRRKLRDYLDIVALDANSGIRLEEGVDFYRDRYRASTADINELIRCLDTTNELMPDRVLDVDPEPILQVLRSRAFDVRAHFSKRARSTAHVSTARALPATDKKSATPLVLEGATVTKTCCGEWMPRTEAYCILPNRHAGSHRSK